MDLVPRISLNKCELGPYEICLHAKQTQHPFNLNESNDVAYFDFLHCDIRGSYQASSLSGACYSLTIVNDRSRAVWIYLTKEKSEIHGILINFHNVVKAQFVRQIKMVRSDNGREFK